MPILHNINICISAGKILALTGNSGAGKSMLCHMVLGLRHFCSSPFLHTGNIVFKGKDLLTMNQKEMLEIYRKDFAFIPQDPLMIFDPLLRVQQHMAQVLKICLGLSKAQAIETIFACMKKAGLQNQAHILSCYPSMLSRGTLQKLALVLALAKNPKMIIADEATSAMDNIAQTQLLSCLHRACTQQNIACILVTHHLGIAAQYADRIALIDEGKICEENSIQEFLRHPKHPKSRLLLQEICQLYACDNIDTETKSY